MGIAVLGPVEVDGGRIQLGHRDRTVLAVLALRPGETFTPDELAAAVWGDRPPASWAKNVQGCVSRLRSHLGADAIRTSAQGYQLEVGSVEIDAQEFVRLVDRVRELLTLGEPDRAAYTAGQALALWRGRAFVELEEWEPGAVEAGRLGELRLEAEELHLEAALRAGRHQEALAQARAMVDAAPLRERRWMLLAQAQYQTGRQADALASLRRLRTVLAEELGLDPGPEVASLEQAILRHDPDLTVPAAPARSSGQCPYPGLTPYTESDADSYFGRERDVDACLARVRDGGLLAVVGPSGCGKSSLVRAGVAVGLRRTGRDVVVISPGRHPMDALTALGDRPSAALIVDQAEETFALCEDLGERTEFLTALQRHSSTGTVVVAMRADRMGDLAAHPEFARLVERGLYLLGAMSAADLRAAVEGPARQAGLVVEPGLVDLLVREVEGEPGALPLLSHALRETWLRREGRTLTVHGYQESGGIRGAVAQSAEDVYAGLAGEQRPQLRDLLLRLVLPGVEGAPVRTRVPRRQVIADPAQEGLVDLLVGSRLVTSGDGMVEIAHEALAREWPRLRGWLDDDLEGQRILHHLASSADAWDQMGRPESELYRGVRLTTAVGWWQNATPELNAVEREFLEASTTVADIERRSAATRARQQARLIRRLRGVVAGAVVLLVAALAAGFLAARQADRANTAAEQADARRVGAKALVTEDMSLDLLLAVAGVRLDRSPETEASLLAVIGKHPEMVASHPIGGVTVVGTVVSPDGSRLATLDAAHEVRLYDLDEFELIARFQAGLDRMETVWTAPLAFSPDGRTLAVGMASTSRTPIVLLDADTLQELPTQPTAQPRYRWRVGSLDFSGDGERLAASLHRITGHGADLAATSAVGVVWDLDRSGRTHRVPLEPPMDFPFDDPVSLSPDGRRLYTSRPVTVHAVDAGTSERLTSISASADAADLALSPDGGLLAVPTGESGDVVLLDTRTGEVRHSLDAGGHVFWAGFSAGGGRLMTTTRDERLTRIWDPTSGEQVSELALDLGFPGAVAIAPDGGTLYSADYDDAMRAWDVAGSRQLLRQLPLHDDTAVGVESSFGVATPAPGGDYVAFGGRGWFLDVEAGRLADEPPVEEGWRFGYGSWQPDGRHYASATGGVVRVWDADTGEVERRAKPASDYINEVDHSPDGTRLATAELDGTVRLLDAGTLEELGEPVTLDEAVCCVALGPDNRTAFVIVAFMDEAFFWNDFSSRWALVDLERGRVLDEGDLGFKALWVDISPDGEHAAASGSVGEVGVVDLDSGELVRPPVKGHEDAIYFFRYSPDGSRIVTGGADDAVALWDGPTGELLARVRLPGRSAQPFYVAEFMRDGHSVFITHNLAERAWMWDTRIEPAIAFACRAAGRDLTQTEWEDNFGDRPYEETCPEDGSS